MTIADVAVYVTACFTCFGTGMSIGMWHKYSINLARSMGRE